MNFLMRRLLHGAGLLLALSLLSFTFSQLAPGDFYTQLRADPHVRPETADALRASSGLNRPFAVRYAVWLTGMVRGDFGYSLAYRAPVASLLSERLANTLLLAASATLLAWLLAIPIGILSAARSGKWFDRAATTLTSLLLGIPDLALAIGLLFLAVQTGWFPAGGKAGPIAAPASDGLPDLLWHMALPVAALAAGLQPMLLRHVRAALLDTMDAPFAIAARAQGIPRRRLLFRHLLPAALNPLITLFGVSLGTLLSASLLVEVVMGWPGVGPLFLEAVMSRDVAIVQAVVMTSASFLMLANLAADVLLYRCDPRIRSSAV